MRVLNRIVEWRHDGIAYEADQRHAEIIISGMGFRGNTKRGYTTMN